MGAWFFRLAAPMKKAPPSGDRERHEVRERGGMVFPPGRPKEKCTPSGGRERHEVRERGGIT
jgi:hypothetical protein